MDTFLRRTARFASTLFIPPFLFLLIVVLITNQLPLNHLQAWAVWGAAFIFGTVLPILYFVVMVRRGRIVNQDAEKKEERTVPYLVGMGLLLAGVLLLWLLGIRGTVFYPWYCYIGNSLLIIGINRYWKISAHAMGASAPLALAASFGIPVFFFYFVLVAVCWSRLHLKVHTPMQVLAGAVTGYVSVVAQLLLFTKL